MNVLGMGRMGLFSIVCIGSLAAAACQLHSATGPSGTYYSFSASAAEAAASAPRRPDASPTSLGLTRDSYGPLTKNRISQADDFSIRSCDPARQRDPGTAAMALGATEFLLSPLARVTKADESIQKLRLTEFFPISSDILFGPVVAVIDPRPDAITFWHQSDLVPYNQVANAAVSFCGRDGMKAVYAGSATHCWTQHSQGKVKHPTTLYDTFAISEFQCKN